MRQVVTLVGLLALGLSPAFAGSGGEIRTDHYRAE